MIHSIDTSKPIAIYGFGYSGKKLARKLKEMNLKIQCFIDQRATPGQILENIPCISPQEVDPQIEQVVLGVFNREVSPKQVSQELRSRGVKCIVGYNEVNRYIGGAVSPSFWYDPSIDVEEYSSQIETFRNLLADDVSKSTLDKIIKYRKSGSVADHPEGKGLISQYFDAGIPGWLEGNSLLMLDCGAFDGDTIESAIENNAPISEAFCFEPDIKNFKSLTHKIRQQDKISCIPIPCATWDSSKILYFSADQGESSRVAVNSSVPVQAIAIDDFIANKKYDFLKVDVEGADLETIKGAMGSIEKHRPFIAVGVYHKPKDIWEIPLFLAENLRAYKFYLRQHGHYCIDTVLYCVP